MTEHAVSIRRLIYYAARDGMSMRLSILLSTIPENDLIGHLEHLNEEDGQKCTPLMIAVLNGNGSVVKTLLRYNIDIEQEGAVLLDGYLVEGATALWCAVVTGNLNIVKTLVSFGTNINHSTSTKSTPLRAACYEGSLDIIQYLIQNGADIHLANKYNSTCLMIASYRGHSMIVMYLLSKNAGVNVQTQCGSTALHFAAEHGNLYICKLLLQNGAEILKNETGMTPLITAANRTREDVVNYMISTNRFTKEECLEALELLGASYANDKDNYSIEKAYYYLDTAMKIRCDSPKLYKPKKRLPAILAYDNHIECQTLEELQAIKHDTHALHMESLLIQERILGPKNTEVPHAIIFRGAIFADIGQFDKCINLMLHALHLYHNNNVPVQEDLLRFAQLFSQMLHIGVEVPFSSLCEVMSVAVEELEKNSLSLQTADSSTQNVTEELVANMLTVLYLFVVSTKLAIKFTPEEEQMIYEFVYKINKLKLVTQTGSTLLHLAVCTNTPVDDFHTKNVCKFPCAATTRMLIQCGADVNAIDHYGNTPLHIIVSYPKAITDFMTLHSIINQLIEAGAHFDAVNKYGKTPIDSVINGVAEIILRTQYKMSLKCIAAKAVRQFNISYEDRLPDSLKTFTDMHGIPQKV